MSNDKLDRIEVKVDKIEDHLGKQEVNLARLTVSVEEHVKRSNMLEDKIKPIEEHVSLVNASFKLLALLATLAAIADVALRLLGI